jgi:NAD(P)-dependent dehydrogenase (short-subunit alcohol dehydrogenase family)
LVHLSLPSCFPLFSRILCEASKANRDALNSPIGGERVANTTHPHEMHFIQTNVANEQDWEQLIENTLDKWGRMDILVNNAGTSYKNKVNSIILPLTSKLSEREEDDISKIKLTYKPSQQWKSPKMNSTKSLL